MCSTKLHPYFFEKLLRIRKKVENYSKVCQKVPCSIVCQFSVKIDKFYMNFCGSLFYYLEKITIFRNGDENVSKFVTHFLSQFPMEFDFIHINRSISSCFTVYLIFFPYLELMNMFY